MLIGDLRCCVCGAADLIAVKPGHDLQPSVHAECAVAPVPHRAWCIEHWPLLQRLAAGRAAGRLPA